MQIYVEHFKCAFKNYKDIQLICNYIYTHTHTRARARAHTHIHTHTHTHTHTHKIRNILYTCVSDKICALYTNK